MTKWINQKQKGVKVFRRYWIFYKIETYSFGDKEKIADPWIWTSLWLFIYPTPPSWVGSDLWSILSGVLLVWAFILLDRLFYQEWRAQSVLIFVHSKDERRHEMDSCLSQGYYREIKRKQFRSGFKLVSLSPFSTRLTNASRTAPRTRICLNQKINISICPKSFRCYCLLSYNLLWKYNMIKLKTSKTNK